MWARDRGIGSNAQLIVRKKTDIYSILRSSTSRDLLDLIRLRHERKGNSHWVNTNISPASFHLIHPHIPPPTAILTNLHHNTVPEHMPHHLSCPT